MQAQELVSKGRIMHRSIANRPYLIATAIVVVAFYCGLIVWVALRPSEALSPDNKVFLLFLLILLPGQQALDRVFKWYDLHPSLQKRLSGMAFVGVLIGLFRAVDASGVWVASITFLVAFILASIAYLSLDYSINFLWARWKRR